MPRVYSLKSFNVGGDKHELGDVLGKRLSIRRITRTASRQYGDGIELVADVSDDTTGELLGTGWRFVTFSGPVVRDLGSVLSESDTWDLGADSLDVIVQAAGQAYVIEDAPAKVGAAVVESAEVVSAEPAAATAEDDGAAPA